MEGLNALACCAGFDPEENPAFWHRELLRLGTASTPPLRQRLSSDLFSRYYVSYWCIDCVPSFRAACGLATCVSNKEAMKIRRDIMAQLREFLLTPPPPLDVVVGFSHLAFFHGPRSYFLDVAGNFVRIQRLQDESAKVAIGRAGMSIYLVGNKLKAIHDGIREHRIEVTEIDGHVTTINSGSFQAVLARLSAVDTVGSMSWSFSAPHTTDAVQLCSAAAYMRSLKSLEVTSVDFDCDLAWMWLAFALKRRKLGGLPALALSLRLERGSCEAFERAMGRNSLTFACLVPKDIRGLLAFTHFPLGTSAKTATDAQLTQDLLPGGACNSSGGERVDVLASAGSRSIIVVPAYGLLWIDTKKLSEWNSLSQRRRRRRRLGR